MQADRLDEALAAIDRAVRLDPKRANFRWGRGEILAQMGRGDEARAAYEDAVRLDPKDANIREKMGGMLAYLGRDKEALESYDEAVRLDPKSPYGHEGGAPGRCIAWAATGRPSRRSRRPSAWTGTIQGPARCEGTFAGTLRSAAVGARRCGMPAPRGRPPRLHGGCGSIPRQGCGQKAVSAAPAVARPDARAPRPARRPPRAAALAQ